MKDKITLSILIILISFIYGLPNIILNSKLGSGYTPFTLSGKSPIARDEAFAYAPEAAYVLKGNILLKDIYSAEYANYPTPFMGESAPAIVFALLSLVSGSLEKAFVAADFIFPPLVFLLLYLVSKVFIKNNFYAASTAFLSTISRDLIAVIPNFHETKQLLSISENQNYLLYFSRAFHPQLTFIFFAGTFLLTLNLIKFPKSKVTILLLSFLFGTLFYSYVFYWTFFTAFYAALIAFFIFKKEKTILKSLILVGSIAFVIAVPYFHNMYQFYMLDLAKDFTEKSSLKGIALPITLLRYLFISVFFFIFYPKKNYKFFTFFVFLMAGVLISPISKIIIGQDLETFHYLRRALMPFSTIAFFTSIYFLINRRRFLVNFVAVLIIITFGLYGLIVQTIGSDKIYPVHKRDTDKLAVLAWLKNNTQTNSVVGSIDMDFNPFIPIYTNNKVYFPPTDRTITPTTEGVQRYAILSALLGLNNDWQKENLNKIISYLFIYKTYDGANGVNFYSKARLDAEQEIETINTKKRIKIRDMFYLDYLILTPEHFHLASPDVNILETETSINGYVIFKIRKK